MKTHLTSFIILLAVTTLTMGQNQSAEMSSWGAFVPYESTTKAEPSGFTIDDRDIRFLGLQRQSRFLSPDPMAHMYPGFNPYAYSLNNPLVYIDPDGREVRCYSETQCGRLVSDVQQLYGEAPVAYEQRTQTTRTWFGFGPEKTTSYYALTVDGGSDYNWGQDNYASALYDAIASEDVIFDVFYSEQMPFRHLTVDGQEYGGGRFLPTSSSRASIYVDPRGDQRTGIPSSIILMHEMIGHGHPVATPLSPTHQNAHDINRFYQQKLGIQQRAPYRRPHQGYKSEVRWPMVNLYQNR